MRRRKDAVDVVQKPAAVAALQEYLEKEGAPSRGDTDGRVETYERYAMECLSKAGIKGFPADAKGGFSDKEIRQARQWLAQQEVFTFDR